MADVEVVELTGYQWQCSACYETGFLELTEEFAKEAGSDHKCLVTHGIGTEDER